MCSVQCAVCTPAIGHYVDYWVDDVISDEKLATNVIQFIETFSLLIFFVKIQKEFQVLLSKFHKIECIFRYNSADVMIQLLLLSIFGIRADSWNYYGSELEYHR